MKNDNWIVCGSCDSEYKIVSSVSNEQSPWFCPYCGTELNEEEEIEEDLEY